MFQTQDSVTNCFKTLQLLYICQCKKSFEFTISKCKMMQLLLKAGKKFIDPVLILCLCLPGSNEGTIKFLIT